MTRRRFYAPPSAFSSSLDGVTLASHEARHLREVLRLKTGEEVYVFDGAGKEFRCRVEDSRRDRAGLQVLAEVAPARPESPLLLTLAVALLKGEKFDLVVQKATELGVIKIVPVKTTNADIHLHDQSDAVKRVTRWQRIALEAAKQSGRALVPEVTSPINFASLIETASAAGNGVMFSERDGRSLFKARERLPANLSSLTALVGPEGGWTDEELATAREAGWKIVTLGGRTLRAETAAITAVALLQHLFGDLA
ncbi:MAG TPA: 16S rRNA (uracil(1498)-N(3))-methyltransferase [Blastocatellia bacterium]|jgi:16S rRNA (uracil1498-N3)-methyltransferase|nr:16S rRNA (uracil(1498)-N(3))-methyltransferase [Blastocatellia bacterium]HAF24333.1 16S rRNA (uracil(1498)-N(3))-methyltransferase [Blastocatellia bacterium]HCX30923.1 16S rRNA (uracil(1498)-N(3))-methyltransferase [Blastocatellia bacterium]